MQVERDPRTGATVVRSVAPVSAPAGARMTSTVFDDGRKSIHAVSGVGGQPSTEELSQILSAIDGVGMTALLEEVTLTPGKAEAEGWVPALSACHTAEDSAQVESSKRSELEVTGGLEDCSAIAGDKEEKSIMVVKNTGDEISNMDVQKLEECPVTLLFLGYTDSTPEQGQDQEDYEGMLTAERVIITDEGEEQVLGDVPSASPQVGEDSQDPGYRVIPLGENGAAGAKIQGEEGDDKLKDASLPSRAGKAEGGAASKRKTCQCCSVM